MSGHFEPVMVWVEDDPGDDPEEEEDWEAIDERNWEREQEQMASCSCGAFVLSKKSGSYVQVADCCCGAM